MSAKVVSGLCGVCPSACWVDAHVEDGRLIGLEPSAGAPPAMFCTLGAHAAEIVHSEHRLRHPLRRSGAKGGFDFERVGWGDAMAEVVARLEAIKAEHGPEATCIYTGRGSFEQSLCDLFTPADAPVSSASSVLFPFGSPNTTGVGALCYVAFAMIAPWVTLGEILVDMYSDVDNAELIVVWGANPATDSPPTMLDEIVRARRRGAEVVVIDPRRSETARAADAEWVPIRPGTDGALALGMIRVLVEEELYDDAFVREFTVGFDELARHVQHFRPETVEEITGVPADTVVRLGRRIAAARGASPIMYSGLEYSDGGVQAIRATLVLWALAGQLDVPGGRNIRMRDNAFPINRSRLVPNPCPERAVGRERFPIYSQLRGESHAIALPEAVLEGRPYPVRALVVLGASLITSWPDPELWRSTLAGLDLLVVIDRQMTADAAWADIVLPATTGFEISSYQTYGPILRLRERVVPPVGEARNDALIQAELARRLGYGHLFPQSEEEVVRWALEGSGFTLEEVRAAGGQVRVPTEMMQFKKWEKGILRDDGRPGFRTPSGKLEIASSILAEHGYEPLPVYTEPGEGPRSRPDLAARHPLVLGSGTRVPTDFRSQHHGVSSLVKMAPEPTVTMSPADAAARGIEDGARVHVASPRGRIELTAKITDDILPGMVDASMGGGGPVGPEAWREANVNELTDPERFDPVSGFPVYKTLLAEVTAADGRRGKTPAEGADAVVRELLERTPAEAPASRRRVYLDHNATTPVAEAVREAMAPYLADAYGNPSSIHDTGHDAARAVAAARRQVARLIGCTARRIVFTGCGTEADNLALKGIALRPGRRPGHLVTSTVEHPAVLNACRYLERLGWRVTYLEVDTDGLVSPEALSNALCDDTALVSIMAANNEVGTVQPVGELAAVARKRGVLFHTDAVQGLGKIPVDVAAWEVDLASFSAHKVNGPKGVGALYVRRGIELEPLLHGGRQEHGERAGTENVAGIVGFGAACELASANLADMDRVAALRDRLEEGVRRIVPEARLNGHPERRLPNTLNMTLPGLRGESLVMQLGHHGVALSSGSACKAGSPEPSHALLALGLDPADAHCALRFSLGHDTSEEDVDHAVASLEEVLRQSRETVRFLPCR